VVLFATLVINGERMVKAGPHFFTTKNLLTTQAFWYDQVIRRNGELQSYRENTLALFYTDKHEPVILYYYSGTELQQAIDDMTKSLQD
jgi:hypothetical protein